MKRLAPALISRKRTARQVSRGETTSKRGVGAYTSRTVSSDPVISVTVRPAFSSPDVERPFAATALLSANCGVPAEQGGSARMRAPSPG
jgi:hypothetical protein